MLENYLLHALARVTLRVMTPLRAKRMVDAAGRALRALSPDEALRVASRLEGHGTCLSRSLTLAANRSSTPTIPPTCGGCTGNFLSSHP